MNCIKLIFCLLICFAFSKSNAQNVPKAADGEWKGPQPLAVLAAAPVALIPFPQNVQWGKGAVILKHHVTIVCFEKDADSVKNAVQALQNILATNGERSTRQVLKANSPITPGAILIQLKKDLPTKPEGYLLEVNKTGTTISGKDANGVFYGVQTFGQLLRSKNNVLQLPACKILDWPAFALRGFMYDNGRNFQEIAELKKLIDHLSAYKFNTFHWHLTDNPAWRPQSNVFPQLNDPKNRKPGRDPERSYSFADIKELISYAKQHCIKIIPELDMPGHSAYFKKTFGFKMETEQGMAVLEKLIDEFCAEIPASDCPIIHLGSDEVHIPNPKEFLERMTARVKANGRKVMIWNPGLKGENGTIEQLWFDDAVKKGNATISNPYVDSYAGYLNSYDALTLIQRYFFQQVCNRATGDSLALGGIICCWNDTRLDDKQKITLYNPVLPGLITYSEAVWCGRPQLASKYMSVFPGINTTAGKYFHEFEKRLAQHRDRFFKNEYFPYVQFGNINWKMTGPFLRKSNQPANTAFAPEDNTHSHNDTVKTQLVTGGVLRFDAIIDAKILSKTANETVYISSRIYSPNAKQIRAWIGFETAVRSNRRSAGIPAAGKWDANGGTVWVNNKELTAPQWQQPGANRYLSPTWETPANEIPYTDEEFYWSRKPAAIQLKKGWNKITMRVPRTYNDQAWMAAFIPVMQNGQGRWVEDTSVQMRAADH